MPPHYLPTRQRLLPATQDIRLNLRQALLQEIFRITSTARHSEHSEESMQLVDMTGFFTTLRMTILRLL